MLLTAVAPQTYRAEESSILGEFSYGDLIEGELLSDGSLRLLEIVARSGLKTNEWILTKDMIESEGFRLILESVIELGGMWEQVLGGVLLVHLPPDVADAVEKRINRYREESGTHI